MASDGPLFGTLTKKQKEDVIKTVAKEAAKRFIVYRDALKTSVDFKTPNSEGRLALYRARLPEVWAQVQATNPAIYKTQIEEWTKMEIRSAARQLSPFNPFAPKSGAPVNTPQGQQGEL